MAKKKQKRNQKNLKRLKERSLKKLLDLENYDEITNRMKTIRSYDLNLVDRSDFIIAHLVPEVASWGSAEEIVTAVRMKKPIFISMEGVQFDDLRNLCRGHVFSDIADITLSFGLGPLVEIDIIKNFCSSLGVDYDKPLYDLFYAVELRKKCISYLIRYLKEVYLYESQRVYEIVRIIDEFSLSYERMCKIPAFEENREFIRKNITEPVLEDGPNS